MRYPHSCIVEIIGSSCCLQGAGKHDWLEFEIQNPNFDLSPEAEYYTYHIWFQFCFTFTLKVKSRSSTQFEAQASRFGCCNVLKLCGDLRMHDLSIAWSLALVDFIQQACRVSWRPLWGDLNLWDSHAHQAGQLCPSHNKIVNTTWHNQITAIPQPCELTCNYSQANILWLYSNRRIIGSVHDWDACVNGAVYIAPLHLIIEVFI